MERAEFVEVCVASFFDDWRQHVWAFHNGTAGAQPRREYNVPIVYRDNPFDDLRITLEVLGFHPQPPSDGLLWCGLTTMVRDALDTGAWPDGDQLRTWSRRRDFPNQRRAPEPPAFEELSSHCWDAARTGFQLIAGRNAETVRAVLGGSTADMVQRLVSVFSAVGASAETTRASMVRFSESLAQQGADALRDLQEESREQDGALEAPTQSVVDRQHGRELEPQREGWRGEGLSIGQLAGEAIGTVGARAVYDHGHQDPGHDYEVLAVDTPETPATRKGNFAAWQAEVTATLAANGQIFSRYEDGEDARPSDGTPAPEPEVHPIEADERQAAERLTVQGDPSDVCECSHPRAVHDSSVGCLGEALLGCPCVLFEASAATRLAGYDLATGPSVTRSFRATASAVGEWADMVELEHAPTTWVETDRDHGPDCERVQIETVDGPREEIGRCVCSAGTPVANAAGFRTASSSEGYGGARSDLLIIDDPSADRAHQPDCERVGLVSCTGARTAVMHCICPWAVWGSRTVFAADGVTLELIVDWHPNDAREIRALLAGSLAAIVIPEPFRALLRTGELAYVLEEEVADQVAHMERLAVTGPPPTRDARFELLNASLAAGTFSPEQAEAIRFELARTHSLTAVSEIHRELREQALVRSAFDTLDHIRDGVAGLPGFDAQAANTAFEEIHAVLEVLPPGALARALDAADGTPDPPAPTGAAYVTNADAMAPNQRTNQAARARHDQAATARIAERSRAYWEAHERSFFEACTPEEASERMEDDEIELLASAGSAAVEFNERATAFEVAVNEFRRAHREGMERVERGRTERGETDDDSTDTD